MSSYVRGPGHLHAGRLTGESHARAHGLIRIVLISQRKDWTYFRGVYVVHGEALLQGTCRRRERKHVGRSLGDGGGAQQTDTLGVQAHLGHTAGGLQRRRKHRTLILQPSLKASYDGAQPM